MTSGYLSGAFAECLAKEKPRRGVAIKNLVPQYSRIVRSVALSVRERLFVEAAHAIGGSNARIMIRHVLPNCLAPIIVQTTLSLGWAIVNAAGLSFLGLEGQPPTAEWGAMLLCRPGVHA